MSSYVYGVLVKLPPGGETLLVAWRADWARAEAGSPSPIQRASRSKAAAPPSIGMNARAASSFDHLVGARHEALRNRKAKSVVVGQGADDTAIAQHLLP